jgi:pyruvate kinase
MGVEAVVTQAVDRMSDAVEQAAQTCRTTLNARDREQIVVVAGVPFGQSGATNALRIATIAGTNPVPQAAA